MANMNLTEEMARRYARNIRLSEVGEAGQKKLLNAKVLCIGAGGLGSPNLFFLAAAGIGTIGIADGDCVDWSNLNRQILHSTSTVGQRKVDSAKNTLHNLNPGLEIITYDKMLTPDNIEPIIGQYDVVIDGTDNFDAKFLINDACVAQKKPYVHGGVIGWEGQVMMVLPGQSACYRCLYRNPPEEGSVPSPAEVGILGIIPGVIGGIQATEVIKYILGVGDLLINQLLYYSALEMSFRSLEVSRRKDCAVCGALS